MNAVPSKVLIIDDDEAVTQTFAGILRLEGHEVRDRKSTRLNSSHIQKSRMPSSA